MWDLKLAFQAQIKGNMHLKSPPKKLPSERRSNPATCPTTDIRRICNHPRCTPKGAPMDFRGCTGIQAHRPCPLPPWPGDGGFAGAWVGRQLQLPIDREKQKKPAVIAMPHMPVMGHNGLITLCTLAQVLPPILLSMQLKHTRFIRLIVRRKDD